jgi:hypothetical protein
MDRSFSRTGVVGWLRWASDRGTANYATLVMMLHLPKKSMVRISGVDKMHGEMVRCKIDLKSASCDS